jgi:hypothetical protein
MIDNLIEALSGGSYISADSGSAPAITGSNNLFFGAGAAPPYLTGSISGDPLLANAAGGDFHLTRGSPAVDAGKPTSVATDIEGTPRPAGTAFDVGAYEVAP